MVWEWYIIRLVLGKLWGGMKSLQGAGGTPQPFTLNCAGLAAAHLQFYRDESGSPEVREANK